MTEDELLHCDIRYRGTGIISMLFHGHCFKDTCCFMPATLDKLCKDFRVECPKLKEFVYKCKTLSNMELCMYKEHLTFSEFMDLEQTEPGFWSLYSKYCEYDCKSLIEIWKSFSAQVESCVKAISPKLLQTCTLNACNTIGSLGKKILNKSLKLCHKSKKHLLNYHTFLFKMGHIHIKDEVDKVDFDKYDFVCKFKRGGISHCHQAGKHTESICSADITSQYPSALMKMRIPVGESKWVTKYDGTAHGYYHLYDIVWNPYKRLKPVADRGRSGVLQWDDQNLESAYIDSEMLKYLLEHKYIKSFKVEKGLVSHAFMYGKTLFGKYVNSFFSQKKLEDLYKDTEDERYNNAFREVLKLFLNALTGKLVENPSRYWSLTYLNVKDFEPKRGNNLHGMAIEKTPNDKRPYNLWVNAGCMVYSYSKRLLFEYIHCLPNNDNMIHIETDGLYFPTKYKEHFTEHVNNYVDIRDEYPIAFGAELGNIKWEHESEGDSYFLGKKFYYIYCINDGEIKKCKGIPKETINKHGTKVTLLTKEIFETVYSGEEHKCEFSRIVKNCFGQDTRMTTHMQTRTIRPQAKYYEYA